MGSYAGGMITRDHLRYEGYQSGNVVLASDTVKVETLIQPGLKTLGEREVGRLQELRLNLA